MAYCRCVGDACWPTRLTFLLIGGKMAVEPNSANGVSVRLSETVLLEKRDILAKLAQMF